MFAIETIVLVRAKGSGLRQLGDSLGSADPSHDRYSGYPDAHKKHQPDNDGEQVTLAGGRSRGFAHKLKMWWCIVTPANRG